MMLSQHPWKNFGLSIDTGTWFGCIKNYIAQKHAVSQNKADSHNFRAQRITCMMTYLRDDILV